MQNPTRLLFAFLLAAPIAPAQLGAKFVNAATTPTYIEVPYSPTLVPQTGITVEAWLTYDESTLGTGWRWPTVMRQNPVGGSEAFWLRVDAGQTNIRSLAFGIRTSVGLTRVGYTFAAGELKNWTHVAATYDGAVSKLYINGVQKAISTQTLGPKLLDAGGVLRIGNGDGMAIETWNGELDEVRLWPVARTAAEIQSTMNLALASVPGEVSTWNLDFSPRDSSGGNSGKDVNSPSYGVNTLKLTTAPLGVTAFGASTPGCGGALAAGATGHAKAGNAGFGLTCLRAADTSAQGAIGLLWLGLGRLSAPIKVDGADVWVNPAVPGFLVGIAGNANGLTNLGAPIPASTPVNAKVYFQFFFHHPSCASVPLFASEGLELVVQ
ncbi:MAG: LamG domain-containing protein [Planctomycetes bacterium]|nr:LamG domain-containing protein [Planctomycetota bacterium]